MNYLKILNQLEDETAEIFNCYYNIVKEQPKILAQYFFIVNLIKVLKAKVINIDRVLSPELEQIQSAIDVFESFIEAMENKN